MDLRQRLGTQVSENKKAKKIEENGGDRAEMVKTPDLTRRRDIAAPL
jgi:hypothetical protein